MDRRTEQKVAAANERAANASKEAEAAKMETTKIAERLAKVQEVRRLKTEQIRILANAINADLKKLNSLPDLTLSSVADAEAQIYLMDFVRVFEICEVKVKIAPCGTVQLNTNSHGAVVSANIELMNQEPFKKFTAALTKAEIDFVLEIDNRLMKNQVCFSIMRKPNS